jgi:NAD(P)-dependent dehydrogenase (short-subunit alcohol dehydrogenase family)
MIVSDDVRTSMDETTVRFRRDGLAASEEQRCLEMQQLMMVPLRRLGDPDEVASAAVSLASDERAVS